MYVQKECCGVGVFRSGLWLHHMPFAPGEVRDIHHGPASGDGHLGKSRYGHPAGCVIDVNRHGSVFPQTPEKGLEFQPVDSLMAAPDTLFYVFLPDGMVIFVCIVFCISRTAFQPVEIVGFILLPVQIDRVGDFFVHSLVPLTVKPRL